MKYVLTLLLVFASLLSSAHADTYPKVGEDCTGRTSSLGSTYHMAVKTTDTTKCGSYRNTDNAYAGASYDQIRSYSCPGGGTISGSNCINAPSCAAGQTRNPDTGICEDPPVTCTPPETPDGSGGCHVAECTGGQILNTTSGACQTPPVCGSTEKYNNATNTCFLSTLQCPEHNHANSTNDACLADPPLACPAGQHDDGTYTCIANDATRCSTNQYSGDINGNQACINKPNISASQKAAQDAYAPRLAAEAAELQARLDYYDARDSYIAAQKSSDADPNDAVLAAAASSAYGTMQTAEQNLANSSSATNTATQNQQSAQQQYSSDVQSSTERNTAAINTGVTDLNTKMDASNTALNSIDATLKATGDIGTGDQTTGINSLADLATSALDNTTAATQNGSWFSSGSVPVMPAPGQCVSIAMHYKALQYDFNPCDKLQLFRDMMAYFLYIATTIYIFQIATRPQA